MKTKKKLYNFGGPGDDLSPNLKFLDNSKLKRQIEEQQVQAKKWTTQYLKNQPTELQLAKEKIEAEEYDAADYLKRSQTGRSSPPTKQNPQGLAEGRIDLSPVDPVDILGPGLLKLGIKGISKIPGLVSQTYKINPWAFTPNETNWYRQVGKSAVDDAFKTGTVREINEEVSPRMLKEFEEQLIRMQGNGPEAILSSRKPASPYFGKGELFYPMGRKPNLKSKNPAAKGSADYLIETSLPNESFQPAYVKGMGLGVPTEIGQTAILKPNPALRNIENFKFYEKNWLKGYKEISKPAVKTTASPIPSSQLPRDLEPYISKKIIPATKEEEVFNSFLSTQGQAKEIMKRTKKYDSNGKEILEYGGQLKKKFYAFGTASTNTIGSQYTVGKDGKALASNGSTAPKSNYSNYAGYAQAAVGLGNNIANTWGQSNNLTTQGKVENTVQSVGDTVAGIIPGVSYATQASNMVRGFSDADNKTVINPNTGKTEVVRNSGEAVLDSVVEPTHNQDITAWTNVISDVFTGDKTADTGDYLSTFLGGTIGNVVGDLIDGGENQEEYAKQQRANVNYTSGDSSMKAYAFGGPMPILPKGVNPINKFTDFKDSTFKTHKEKGVGITPNDEVEKNESMYRFGRTKKATGGSSDGGYVFSHILGEDEQGNVSVVPQGSKAPKGWKSYADMSREAMS